MKLQSTCSIEELSNYKNKLLGSKTDNNFYKKKHYQPLVSSIDKKTSMISRNVKLNTFSPDEERQARNSKSQSIL